MTWPGIETLEMRSDFPFQTLIIIIIIIMTTTVIIIVCIKVQPSNVGFRKTYSVRKRYHTILLFDILLKPLKAVHDMQALSHIIISLLARISGSE